MCSTGLIVQAPASIVIGSTSVAVTTETFWRRQGCYLWATESGLWLHDEMPTNSNNGPLQLGEIGKDNEGNSKANKGQDDTSKKCKCAPSKHRSDAMYGEESLSSESSEKNCNIRSQPELWPHKGQDDTSKKCKCAPSKHCSDTMDGEESLDSESSGNYGDIRSQPELWPTFDFMRVLHDVYHASDSFLFRNWAAPLSLCA